MYQLIVMDDMEDAARATAGAVAASPLGVLFSVTTVTGADELRDLLEGGFPCDVLIADIKLGDGARENGIQVVGNLLGRGSATQVIYLTGFIEYCTEVYETDHLYFLTKPIRQAALNKALARAVENLRRVPLESLVVKAGRAVIAVPLREIVFIESRLRKLEVHAGGRVHITYGTIADIMEKLPAGFVRAHKSFVVNLAHATQLEGDELVLRTGEHIPVSKRRRQEVRAAFFVNLSR